MKKHLTELSVERVRPPKEGSVEIFDLGYPGLALRVGNGGAKSFVLFHRRDGDLKRVTLGRWPRVSLSDARNSWRTVREGKPLAQEQTSGETFGKVVEEWLARDQAKNKQATFYQSTRMVEHDLLPVWKDRPVTALGKKDVVAVLDGIMDRGAVVKARRVHAQLNRFFRWCCERDILKANPMAELPRPGSEESRDRVLTDEELAKVWQAAGELNGFGTIAKLLILTGARREEITQLRWSEIDGDSITLSNGRTKTGKPHVIPLSAPARELLNSVPHIADSEFVFTVDGKGPLRGWSRAKARFDTLAKIEPWRLHDLRRTCATGLQRLGTSLQVVEAVLGHVSGSRGGIVGVYQRHSFAEEKRAALEAWGGHVTNLNKV